MRRLEEILKTINNKERLQALLEYAKFLNVDIGTAKNEYGALIENRLILLIYDGEEAKKFRRNANIGVWVGSCFLVLMLFIVTWLVIKMVK